MPGIIEQRPVNRRPRAARATVRVAIAGCGAVGSALVRELEARRDALRSRHGLRVELSAVLVRDVDRRRDARLEPGTLGSDVERFLAADADVLVEAMGGITPAREIVEHALRRGMTVLTANKALLAAHGTSLVALAARHGATLRYDAAVGGGVPVLRVIDDALGAGVPLCIRGILNGTTNFVLTRLERGDTLEQALAEARARGFAEADASRDLDGRDAAAKISIIAWAAYGIAPEAVTVRRVSLLPDPSRYSALAARLGGVVRQVAECALVDGEVVASVEPVVVAPSHAFAHTRDEQNRVEVHTGWTAPLCASGPGAGGVPTATALLSDLLATGEAAPRHSRAREAGTDTRRARWAIDARCTPALLHALCERIAVVHTNATADRCWLMVHEVTPAEITRLVDALAHAGASPAAVRLLGFGEDDAA